MTSASSPAACLHQPHYLSTMHTQEQRSKEGGRYLLHEQKHGNTPPSPKKSESSMEDDSGISASVPSLSTNKRSHLPSTPVNIAPRVKEQQLLPTAPDQSTHIDSPSFAFSSSEDEEFEKKSERKTSRSKEESQAAKGEKELVMTDNHPAYASHETDVAERLRNLAFDIEQTGAEKEAFKKENLSLKRHNLDLQKNLNRKKIR